MLVATVSEFVSCRLKAASDDVFDPSVTPVQTPSHARPDKGRRHRWSVSPPEFFRNSPKNVGCTVQRCRSAQRTQLQAAFLAAAGSIITLLVWNQGEEAGRAAAGERGHQRGIALSKPPAAKSTGQGLTSLTTRTAQRHRGKPVYYGTRASGHFLKESEHNLSRARIHILCPLSLPDAHTPLLTIPNPRAPLPQLPASCPSMSKA